MFTGAILNCAPFLGLTSDLCLFVMAKTAFSSEGSRGTRVRGAECLQAIPLLCLWRECLPAAVSCTIHYETLAVSSAKMRALHPLICRYEGKSTNLSNRDVIAVVPAPPSRRERRLCISWHMELLLLQMCSSMHSWQDTLLRQILRTQHSKFLYNGTYNTFKNMLEFCFKAQWCFRGAHWIPNAA